MGINYSYEIYRAVSKIDENESAILIYGGISKQDLPSRLKQHQYCDERFENMKIVQIARIKNEYEAEQSRATLVKELRDKFGDKCINKRGENSMIDEIDGKYYYLYVCYK